LPGTVGCVFPRRQYGYWCWRDGESQSSNIVFAVPANHYGHQVYSAAQLKTIQEVVTLIVFAVFSISYLGEALRWNHVAAFACLVAAAHFFRLRNE
jgi:uncharacterized protein (DUF486 family)